MPSLRNLLDISKATDIIVKVKQIEAKHGVVTGYWIDSAVQVRKHWNKHSETFVLTDKEDNEVKIVVTTNSIVFHGDRNNLYKIIKQLY